MSSVLLKPACHTGCEQQCESPPRPHSPGVIDPRQQGKVGLAVFRRERGSARAQFTPARGHAQAKGEKKRRPLCKSRYGILVGPSHIRDRNLSYVWASRTAIESLLITMHHHEEVIVRPSTHLQPYPAAGRGKLPVFCVPVFDMLNRLNGQLISQIS